MSSSSEASAAREGALRGPPPVQAFEETIETQEPHEGLVKIHQAISLLRVEVLESSDDASDLLAESMEDYLNAARRRSAGGPADKTVVEGAREAARLIVLTEKHLPEAFELVRWFCSVQVDSLRMIATFLNAESVKLQSEGPSEATTARTLRLLRVLIAGFNSFLRNALSELYSSELHVSQLEQAVGFAREAINNICRECTGPVVGKAAARLRGLTAMASFGRLFRDSSAPKPSDEAMACFEVMRKMGYRDVDKLIKCVAHRVKQGDVTAYLQMPHNCLEALAVLRRLAMAAPEVYPLISNAVADAVKCLDGPSRGKWGDRPAFKSAMVRHSAIACAAHLADRLGRNPDPIRQKAFHNLWKALSDCCVMQSGHYVLDHPVLPGSAAERTIQERAAASKMLASRASGSGSSALPPSYPDSPRSRPETDVTAAGGGSGGEKAGAVDAAVPAAEHKRPRSPIPTATDGGSSASQSNSNARHAPPGMGPASANPSSLWVNPRPTGVSGAPGPAPPPPGSALPPPERKTYPALETVPEAAPKWAAGCSYRVDLGKSFERDSGALGRDKDDGFGHYVHLKYDFVPARTNLDAPATLRQGPIRGADSWGGVHKDRWRTSMEYQSRDSGKPRPVCFRGDAGSAQELECVLVFDGDAFVMDRVSVVGSMKYVQDSSALGSGAADTSRMLPGRARDKGKGKRKRQDQDSRENRRGGREKGGAAKAGGNAGASSKQKGEGRDKTAAKVERAAPPAARIVVAPANRLSQPMKRPRVAGEAGEGTVTRSGSDGNTGGSPPKEL